MNKVATLRNSRGGQVPDVVSAAQACVSAGDEVSIGHAIWAEALFDGIGHVVSDYLALLAADPH